MFTYRELEAATGQFSERNVIGNGTFGVVYRGVLSDGTLAAIKMLRREGKSGERAFRIEVRFFFFSFINNFSSLKIQIMANFNPFSKILFFPLIHHI